MNYTLENFISYCDDMEIVDESLRDTKDIYDVNLDKIKSLMERSRKAKTVDKQIEILNDTIKVIDDTIKELKALTDDNLDKAISAGSKLVSVMLKIQVSKSIITAMATNLITGAFMSAPTFLFAYIGNKMAHGTLKSMSIKEKKKVRDGCIKDLENYKKYVKGMINVLNKSKANAPKEIPTTESTMVAIADESALDIVNAIKVKFNSLIEKLRRWIQVIKNWVDTKIYKLLKMKYISIDQAYYNSAMSFINSIRNLGKDSKVCLDLISANVKALMSDDEDRMAEATEKLQKTYEDINDDLKLLNEERKKIPEPKEGAKKINIPTDDMNAVKAYFVLQMSVGNAMIQSINNSISAMNKAPKQLENGSMDKEHNQMKEKVSRLVMSNTFAMSNLVIGKSQICIQIVNSIMSHGTVVQPK